MHEVLVNRLFKLVQEKVWLGELTLVVDLGRKATKQTNKYRHTPEIGFTRQIFNYAVYYVF